MKHLLILIAVVIAVDSFATKAAACMCALPDNTLRNQINSARTHSRSVFSGQVLKIERSFPVILVTFQVDAVWKGPSAGTVMVTTDTGSCGYGFRIGEKYLVYADAAPKTTDLVTSVCTRTALFSQTADLKLLGKPRRRRT